MTCNNPKLDLVNVDVHTKYGQILSIGSIERKQNSDVNPGIFLPFQNRDPGPMILGKIIRISVKLGKWIQTRIGDNMHIWC